ncbi:MAG: hypothetical protein QM796_15495 [Chthoniobacteraceae bacterium]
MDAEYLRILTICHYVGAGLSVFGMGFLVLHYTIMQSFISNPKMMGNIESDPSPVEFFGVFKWFYLFGAVFLVAYLVLNIISAICFGRRRHRGFSLVGAGLNCVHVPLGTLLGVFTMIVLLRTRCGNHMQPMSSDSTFASGL